MDNLPAGIEIHGKSLRICFTYRGQRCREALKGVAITKPNIKFAERKRAVILHEITIGTFDYGVHFPGSKRAALFSPQVEVKTVNAALNDWLAIKIAKVRTSTFAGYVSKVDNHIRPHLGDLLLTQVTKSQIEALIYGELAYLANKTLREILAILNAVLQSAVLDRRIEYNPMTSIETLPVLKRTPDPFLQEEIERLVNTPTRHVNEINQFEFSCWTGLRMSEAFGLAWEDIDQVNWTAKIQRGFVRGHYGAPKTRGSERTIELLDPAIQVLKRQKALTFMREPTQISVLQEDNKTRHKERVHFVFIQTTTGKPYSQDNNYRSKFFVPHARKAKIRYRSPKQARHTFASQLLTAGAPKEWIINQMGHTSTQMFDERYGKWISEERPKMARLVSNLLSKSDQNAPPAPQKFKG